MKINIFVSENSISIIVCVCFQVWIHVCECYTKLACVKENGTVAACVDENREWKYTFNCV